MRIVGLIIRAIIVGAFIGQAWGSAGWRVGAGLLVLYIFHEVSLDRLRRQVNRLNKTTGPFEALKRSRVSDPDREE